MSAIGYSPPSLEVQLMQLPLVLIFFLFVVIVGIACALLYCSIKSRKIVLPTFSAETSSFSSVPHNIALAIALLMLVFLSCLLQTPFVLFSPLAYMARDQIGSLELYDFLPFLGVHLAFVLPSLFLMLIVRGAVKKLVVGLGTMTLLLIGFLLFVEHRLYSDSSILLTYYPLVLLGIVGVFGGLLRFKHSIVAPLLFLVVATPLAFMQVSLYRSDLHGMQLRVYAHQAEVGDYADYKEMLKRCRAIAGDRFPGDYYGIECSIDVAHRKCGTSEESREMWTEADKGCIRAVQEEYYGKKIE